MIAEGNGRLQVQILCLAVKSFLLKKRLTPKGGVNPAR